MDFIIIMLYFSWIVLLNKFNIIANLCMLLFMYPAIVPGSSREELMVMTVTEIVNQLIQAHQQGKDVNLNRWEEREREKSVLAYKTN